MIVSQAWARPPVVAVSAPAQERDDPCVAETFALQRERVPASAPRLVLRA